MNDDSDKPLNPVGDDALEARITAWVLGEASPFEAAELEELCARNPEARLFVRRLRVLHGLIAADGKASPEDEWKLPSEKRAKIEALFGEPVADVKPDPEPEKIVSIRRTGRRALMALAACTVISVAGWALLNTVRHDSMPSFAMKNSYEAPAKEVEFVAGGGGGGGWGGGVGLEVPASPPATAAKPAGPAEPALAELSIDELQQRALQTRRQLTDPSVADSKKQSVSSDNQATELELAKRAEESGRVDSLAGTVTGGLRSGDGAITRNSVDAILNNPARAQDSPEPSAAPADGFVDGRDFSNLGEMAELVESVAAGGGSESGASVSGFIQAGPSEVVGGIESLGDLGRKESEHGRPLNANAIDTRLWFSQAEGVKSEVGATALMDGPGEAPGYSGLAQKEMIRRQNAVATSDKLRDEGREAYTKGDYELAVDRFRESLDVLPDAEMVQDRRDYLGSLFADGATALGEQYRKVGKYDEARQLAEDALSHKKDSVGAKGLPGWLDDPIRTNPASNLEHTENAGELRRKLYAAEGNYNLGKFDDAHKTYEDVLRVDPYNKAARRGMEQVAQARQDYYRAAYDQTRAQLLAEVDKGWDVPVPQLETPAAPATSLMSDVASGGLKRDLSLDLDAPMDPQNASDLASVDAPESEPLLDSKNLVVPENVAETLTSAEPFSTFSLHVSDASFKLAKAALDRGEVPAADSIRPEEFYNAFDYGDPAPAVGEPVTCAVEQSAHPAIPQRNLLRIGVKTGSQGRGGSTPLNLTLLLDSSGSMEREDRTAGLANAVKQLSGLLKEGDTISVIGFARQPRLLADRLPGARAQELNAIIAQTPSEGGTNLEEGLKLGEELALRQFNPAAQNRIVLFTDGAANLGDAMPETLQAKVEAMRQKGIAFDAAGFGADGLNDKLLERLTRNGNGRYYVVDDAADADANFAKQLAGAFRPAAENVKVQVRFNPARVAKYKLIGFEEHRLKKEDFRNDTVDAAEMAAEEAGNALYQMEVLPQGEGEVGEVSVRFRDAAGGQMVERTWTIPFEAQAPAFDQAKPSLQLAGLAAFAAEKLRAAPLADAVDFQQLAPVLAKVKARYPNSRPVAELEAMIGKLK